MRRFRISEEFSFVCGVRVKGGQTALHDFLVDARGKEGLLSWLHPVVLQLSEMSLSNVSNSFGATHWTVVLEAAKPGSSPSQEVFGKPYSALYSYVRRQGFSPEGSQDITHNLFTRILGKEALRNIQREVGRFFASIVVAGSDYFE